MTMTMTMTSAGAAPSALMKEQRPAEAVTVAVCCGCRPAPRRRFRKLTNRLSSRIFGLQKFYDAQMIHNDAMLEGDIGDIDWDKESMYYFDAQEEPLKEDEYPVVFTDFLRHPKPIVSMDHPESLLSPSVTTAVSSTQLSEHGGSSKGKPFGESLRRQTSEPIESGKEREGGPWQPIANYQSRSARLEKMIQRPAEDEQKLLEKPRVEIPMQGYPGGLTMAELAECVRTTRTDGWMDGWMDECAA